MGDGERRQLGGILGAAGAALGAISLLFLPWYGVLGFELSAFDAEFFAWGGALAVIAGGVFAALLGLAPEGNRLQIDPSVAPLLSGLGLGLIILRFVSENQFVKYGLFAGLVAGAVAFGGSLLIANAVPNRSRMAPSPEGIRTDMDQQENPGQPPAPAASDWGALPPGVAEAQRRNPGQPPPPTASDRGPLPPGVAIANPWTRLGSYFLESILMLATLGIGWLIWAMFTGPTGQTPAKKLLGLRVIRGDTRTPAGLGRMFWVRGVLGGIVAYVATIFTLGILLLMPFWDRQNQNIWDKVSNCFVVNDPADAWGTRYGMPTA